MSRLTLATLALVLSLDAFGRHAAAASYDLGTINVPSAHFIAGGTIGFPSTTRVLATYRFSVSEPANFTAEALDIAIWPVINFASLTADLLDASCGNCVLASASGSAGFLLSYADLIPFDTYTLRITGTLGSFAFIGLYKGAFLVVSAAPLPSTLILFGSAVLGLAAMSRRRSRLRRPA